jgi:hypothetical protein
VVAPNSLCAASGNHFLDDEWNVAMYTPTDLGLQEERLRHNLVH